MALASDGMVVRCQLCELESLLLAFFLLTLTLALTLPQ